jgi:signal transduction histidine kinase/CheY-like chemotaxis protein/HAMP domain-containing protein
VRNIAEVSKAIANGDLSKKITVDVKGEILELKNTINTMVDQLNSFASEVTRVAREVGTEGKLGGQAEVKGVAGTWKDLTDSVNQMAGNLTAQVRGIARVVTSVANGDLKRKLALEAKGEIATLADTINEMIDTLATFADQVTTVAREVGIEGKLGGQAKVPGAAGTWRALTDNVNELAATLTTQLRAIAEVATAVTKGDLTRSISVAAQGEVAVLKDNINQMIANLRETTQKNTEQDWLKTNLAKFTRMLQGQRDLETVSKLILSELAPLVSAQHGVFYLMDSESNQVALKLLSTYAYRERKSLANVFHLGEGIVGQCALEKERILLTEVPGNYIKISSGLGESSPLNVVVQPVLFEGQVSAVIELASFQRFSEIHLTFLDQLTESIAIVLNNIAASMKTERLLSQSQSLAQELQSQQKELTSQQKELTDTNKRLELQANSLQTSEELLKKQQEELRQTNEELEEKARILSLKNQEVEQKNREIELAKVALEEKADQLALSSKYKSEFLANMSHELRTPLNSLLLLAKLLADNPESNLTTRQVEFAKTIYSAGSDLLALINDILDLAKIESGTMVADIDNMLVTDLRDNMERTFQQIAFDKGLNFNLEFETALPRTIQTDAKRLEQVIKNLLSNAFKFTLKGAVNLYVTYAKNGWDFDNESLNRAEHVIAFSVIDTGIGIPLDKQKLIFEAFQQADGTTSRKYGGTGLGLSISRELARLLGGEIRLVSSPGKGSTFTFYLPQPFPGEMQRRAYRTSQPQVTSPSQFAFGVHSSTSHLPSSHPFSRVENLLGNIHLPNFSQAPRAFVETEVIDDRESVQPGDPNTLLIIEDDLSFAKILLEFSRKVGFKGVVTTKGDSGLSLSKSLRPAAIVLDLRLPSLDGWKILDRLKHNPATRHIPVQVISIEDWRQCLDFGAFGFLKKPVTNDALENMFASLKTVSEKRENGLAILESDDVRRKSVADMIGNGDVYVISVSDLESLQEVIDSQQLSCLVMGPTVDGMTFLDVLHKIKGDLVGKNISVVVWSEREMLPEQMTELKRFGEFFPIKLARNLEQILDETTLLLHRVEANLPEPKRRILEQLHRSEPKLAGRRVLIVDDDVRNIFALTSLLERHNMDVLHVEDGQTAVELLSERNDTDLVLMDIMMPGMDGYETMKVIRAMPQYRSLPIIALTAQAMKGDREKCLSAGASDYVTKPVDAEELLSLLRLWLSADHDIRNMTAQSWDTALGSLRLKQ